MKPGSILLSALVCVFLLFITCTKHTENNIVETKRGLLTKDTLFYDEQILWWNSPNQTIAFKRGGCANSNDLLKAWFKYEVNGSFKAALSNGHSFSGNWEFLDNATKIRLSSKELSQNETFEIITLANNKFEWTDLSHSSFYRQVSKR